VEIDGIDEAGRIGETIFFVRVGVPLPAENRILLHNLDHFDKLIVDQSDLKGRSSQNLFRYVKRVIDDPSISMSIFAMRSECQLRLLRRLWKFESDKLFKFRKRLIDAYESEDITGLSEAIGHLEIFENPSVYAESFVKGFGIQEITRRLDVESRLFLLKSAMERLLVVQVDGGYPFAFWWKSFLESPDLKNIKRGNTFFTGLTSGDRYYPVISAAGTIASVFRYHAPPLTFYGVHEIECPANEDLPNEDFCSHHASALSKPIYQYRMLLLGSMHQTIRSLMPYAIHREDRRKTYEVFSIERSAEDFLKNFGGKPDSTVVLYGDLTSEGQRENLRFLKESGYECFHTSDKKSNLESLFGNLEEQIDVAPTDKRKELLAKVQRIRAECEGALR